MIDRWSEAAALEVEADRISGALWAPHVQQDASTRAYALRKRARELAEEQIQEDLAAARVRRREEALRQAKREAEKLLGIAPHCRRRGLQIPLTEIQERLPEWLSQRTEEILGGKPPQVDLIYG
jgi:hypothetical protein